MAILFDVLYRARSILRGERNGTASNGATNAIYDTLQSELNDYFNGGVIFVFTGNNANKSRRISDWDSAQFKFTFSSMGALACGEGDLYAAFDARYTRQDLVSSVNRALGVIGPFDEKDETITTTSNTERYALTAGVAGVKRVQIATSTTSPYAWGAPRHDWYERDGYLYFRNYQNVPTGYLLRLTYGDSPDRLNDDDDVIPSQVTVERLAAETAYEAAKLRTGKGGNADPEAQADLQIALAYRNEARLRYPIYRLHEDSKHTVLPW